MINRPRTFHVALCAVVAAAVAASPASAAVDIVFDFTYDTAGFFSDPSRRSILDQAAYAFESVIMDDLIAITPGTQYNTGDGDPSNDFSDTWTATFNHPGLNTSVQIVDMELAANEIVVFAGAKNLGGTTLGQGGPGGYSAFGIASFVETVATRGEGDTHSGDGTPATDFGPWGGAITFNLLEDWYFGSDPGGISSGESDFLSVAIHEIGHLLGFSTADSYDEHISGSSFFGPNAVKVHGGAVALEPDGHWLDGTTSGGRETVMDPILTSGTTKRELTPLDLAGFADLGWEIIIPSSLDGDFNGDGVVDQSDLTLVLSYWGSGSVPPEWSASFDGSIDQNELSSLLSNWGAGASASSVASVPEPTSVVIVTGAALLPLLRRRRS